MKTLARRIAHRYLAKTASLPDLVWGIDQIEGVAQTLEDVASVWEKPEKGVPGDSDKETLAEAYSEIANASKVLHQTGEKLAELAETLKSVSSEPIPAVTEAKRAAARPGTLDQKTRSAVNRALVSAGMGGKKRFPKAQAALTEVMSILGQVGIIAEGIINSHHFSFPLGAHQKGHFTVDLAFNDPTGQDKFVPIRNSMLSFSFEELAPHKFEVIAYLS